MTHIIFPLAIGLLLLGIVVYWFLQGDAPQRVELSEAHDALGRLRLNFLPVSSVDRIFDYNDFVFVRNQKEPNIVRLLESERKAVGMYWLRHTRQQIRLLMAFYLKSARQSARLSVALELQMALNYLIFLTACNMLIGLIWLRGPVHARDGARRTIMVAARFCTISESLITLLEARHARIAQVSGSE